MLSIRAVCFTLPVALLIPVGANAMQGIDDLDVTIRVIDRRNPDVESFINRIELPRNLPEGVLDRAGRHSGSPASVSTASEAAAAESDRKDAWKAGDTGRSKRDRGDETQDRRDNTADRNERREKAAEKNDREEKRNNAIESRDAGRQTRDAARDLRDSRDDLHESVRQLRRD